MAERRGGSCRAGERPRRCISMRYSSPIYCLSSAAQWGSPLSGTIAASPHYPGPGAAQSRPLLFPPAHRAARRLAPLRGSREVQEVGWPGSLRAEPAKTPAPAPEYFTVEQREGRGGDSLTPPHPNPSGSNLPCIVTTVRNEAGEAGLQLAIELLALQTEGLGLLQIHFYFPGQRLYSLLA